MKVQKLSQGAQLALVAVALVAVAAAGYLFLIAPKRTAATDAQLAVESTQAQIDTLRAAVATAAPQASPVDASELFRLTTAMPDRAEIAEVILELNRIATDTGLRFESISPSPATDAQGYQVIPIALVLQGNFYNLSDFLFRLRNLVAVRDGELSASGRLFNVQSISFGSGSESFPQLIANVTVNAFVYGSGVAEAAPATAAATEETDAPAPAPDAPPADTTTASAAPAGAGS